MAKKTETANVPAVIIEQDGVVINKRIAAFKKQTDAYNAEAHALAVNSLYHAAKSRRPEVLQSFYDALAPAMQGSFRLWLGKRGIDVTKWLSFSATKGFAIIKGTKVQSDAFMETAQFISRPFHDLDANTNKSIVDDKAILGSIMALLRKANDDEASVLPETKAIILDMAKTAAQKLSMIEGSSKLAALALEYSPAASKGRAVESATAH